MTRTDFELIAKAVKRTRDQLAASPWEGLNARTAEANAIDCLVENLASALAGANNRFDRARFLDACGVR